MGKTKHSTLYVIPEIVSTTAVPPDIPTFTSIGSKWLHFSGAAHLNYYGKVYIYYGSKHGIATQPNVTLNYENQSKYTNFGHHLATCNNNNLVIGSPFDSMQTGLVRIINVKDGSHRDMQGSSAYSWFGYSTVCGMDKGREILMVGSPMTRYYMNSS